MDTSGRVCLERSSWNESGATRSTVSDVVAKGQNFLWPGGPRLGCNKRFHCTIQLQLLTCSRSGRCHTRTQGTNSHLSSSGDANNNCPAKLLHGIIVGCDLCDLCIGVMWKSSMRVYIEGHRADLLHLCTPSTSRNSFVSYTTIPCNDVTHRLHSCLFMFPGPGGVQARRSSWRRYTGAIPRSVKSTFIDNITDVLNFSVEPLVGLPHANQALRVIRIAKLLVHAQWQSKVLLPLTASGSSTRPQYIRLSDIECYVNCINIDLLCINYDTL